LREEDVMLTVKEVRKRVAAIRRMRDGGDYEDAHAAEVALHLEVLRAIAVARCEDPRACAGVVFRASLTRRWFGQRQ
jgi:hypothetical protein